MRSSEVLQRLTLVVATCGRRDQVGGLLRSVLPWAARLRVVVVDQNEEDFLRVELAEFAAAMEVAHLRVGFRNASRARNLGAMRAETEWVAFPDDDCRFLEETLPRAMALMETGEWDLIGGRVVNEAGRPHLLRWMETEAEITPQTIDHCFVESSFCVRRDVFLGVGGFDDRFGPGGKFPAAEGADLLRRMWGRDRKGVRMLYTPEIGFYHPEKESERTEAARERIYGFAQGEGALTARHFWGMPLGRVAKKVVFRMGGVVMSRGETRQRKVAYLKGFCKGFAAGARLGSALPCGQAWVELGSATNEPLLSLVVATCGRETELRALLQSLLDEPSQGFEVIVVDQNEDDRVARVVEGFAGRLEIRHLRESVPNASQARNVGAAVALGAWVGFPDDDCRFLPSTMEALRRQMRRDDADVIAGMTCDERGEPVLLQWPGEACEITNRRLRTAVSESTFYMRRELFRSVGGFDSAFGPGSAFAAEEGVDMIRRLWRRYPAGLRMRFSPEIRFYHPDRGCFTDEAALRKTRMYARGRGASFARHWRSASVTRVVEAVAKHAVGCVVLRGLRRRSRVYSLLGYAEGFVLYRRRQWVMRRRARQTPVATRLPELAMSVED